MSSRPLTNPVYVRLLEALAVLSLLLMASSVFAQTPEAEIETESAEPPAEEQAEQSTDTDTDAVAEDDHEYSEDELEAYDEMDAAGDAADAISDEDLSDVEEITVTGSAGAGGTQATPEAITSFNQQQLDQMGISNVDDLALSTPSLHVGQFGAKAMITLRGVGVENVTEIGDPGVIFQVDGIPMGRALASNQTFFDLERIDVARGPQAVDGGRQATGGRIELLSRKAGPETDVFGDFQYGSYDQFLSRAAVNLPILDESLMSRFTLVHEKRDGYQDNLLTGRRSDAADDADNLSTRFQLRSLLADESVELWGIASYAFARGHGAARSLIGPPPFNVEAWRTDTMQPEGAQPVGRGGDARPFMVDDCPNAFIDSIGEDRREFACVPDDPRVTYANEVGEQDNSQAGFTGHATWDLPWLTTHAYLSDMRIKMLGGWHQTIQDEFYDVDATNAPNALFDRRTQAQQGSFEAFIERPDVENFDFKVGLFYFNETVDTHFCYDADGTGAARDLEAQQNLFNQSIATYANAGYRLVDNLRIKAGVRYTVEQKEAIQENFSFRTRKRFDRNDPTNLDPAEPDRTDGCTFRHRNIMRYQEPIEVGGRSRPGPFDVGFDQDIFLARPDDFVAETADEWSKVNPMVGFDWEITDSSTLAFKLSSSFKAGGFPLGSSPEVGEEFKQPYNAEEVLAYELNWKNDFFDNRLRLNSTFFWTDYDPYQFCQLAGPLYFCEADGSATSRGVEIEIQAEPIDNLALNGHFNFLDARLDTFEVIDPSARLPNGAPDEKAPPVDVSGNHLPKAPAFSGSFGIQYSIQAGRFGSFTPRYQLQGQSQTFFRVHNIEELSQEGFVKHDLSLDWVSESERFTIRGFVNNVTDEDVLNFLFVGSPAFGGHVTGQYMAPRTWGVRVGVAYTNDLF